MDPKNSRLAVHRADRQNGPGRPTSKAAINTAARALGKGDLMCVTGSFYIAGEAKKLFDEKAREKVGV